VSELGATAALTGVPVATAVAATWVGCDDVDLDGGEEIVVGDGAFV
jgi:hypothetical protein